MTDTTYIVTAIVVAAIATFALRALPFVAARWLQRHPAARRTGDCLPLAIMTLLVVHTVAAHAAGHDFGPWPELAAIVLTALVQWFARNPLFAITTGTLAYVLMRNVLGAA